MPELYLTQDERWPDHKLQTLAEYNEASGDPADEPWPPYVRPYLVQIPEELYERYRRLQREYTRLQEDLRGLYRECCQRRQGGTR